MYRETEKFFTEGTYFQMKVGGAFSNVLFVVRYPVCASSSIIHSIAGSFGDAVSAITVAVKIIFALHLSL